VRGLQAGRRRSTALNRRIFERLGKMLRNVFAVSNIIASKTLHIGPVSHFIAFCQLEQATKGDVSQVQCRQSLGLDMVRTVLQWDIQTTRSTGRLIDRQAQRHAVQTDRKAHIQADKQTNFEDILVHPCRYTNTQTHKRTDRQAERQAQKLALS
jgi:hypothetical protein